MKERKIDATFSTFTMSLLVMAPAWEFVWKEIESICNLLIIALRRLISILRTIFLKTRQSNQAKRMFTRSEIKATTMFIQNSNCDSFMPFVETISMIFAVTTGKITRGSVFIERIIKESKNPHL